MWHFINIPYLDEGGKISDYNFTFDVHNITEAIDEIVAWFNRAPGYKDGNAYKEIMAHRYYGATELDALSTAMRLLLHYVGDVH